MDAVPPRQLKERPLVLGQKIYRFCNPKTFTYVVVGIRAYQDGELYEVECLQCEHSFKCRCLVAVDSQDAIVHVNFINDDPEDSQRHWHDDKSPYFRTAEECTRYIARQFLNLANEEIALLQERLSEALKRKEKYQGLLKSMEVA